MKRLKRVVHRRRTASIATDTAFQLSVPPEELRVLATDLGAPPRKSGTLLKYTNVLKRWKPRHFTLENGILLYGSTSPEDTDDPEDDDAPSPAASHDHERRFRRKGRKLLHLVKGSSKDDKDRDIKGAINIQHAVVSADDSDLCRFAIDVGNDVYHCKADTNTLRDEWVDALNQSTQYFHGLVKRAVLRAKETASSPHRYPQSNGNPQLHVQNSIHSTQSTESKSTHLLNRQDAVEESEDSILEDDGLREAEESRRALINELGRIVSFWRERWMEKPSPLSNEDNLRQTLFHTFQDKPLSNSSSENQKPSDILAVETAKGLHDLLSWCLHVLQTNDDMFDRRMKADLTRSMGDGLPVFPVSPASILPTVSPKNGVISVNDDDSDSEFFDALSRAVSARSSFAVKHSSSSKVPPLPHKKQVSQPSEDVKDSHVEDPSPQEEKDEPLSQRNSIKRVDTSTLVQGLKGPRTHLPPLNAPRERLNIFSLLKDAVGKDLSKIALPVSLNEPLSFVQRLAEDIEYCELLDQAAEEPDPNRRMMYVAAMVISHYSSTQGRVGKPFNPLLGETACVIRPNKGKGVRFVSEQVSHHPPISACYAEGTGGSWKYYNAIEVKNKFWGKSLEVFPTGLNHIEIPKYGDHYVLEQITSCVHNIVVGRLWLDNYGDMEIVNRTNGGRCVIEFNKTGWMSDAKSFGKISGTVYGPKGEAVMKLGGNWTSRIYEDMGRGKKRDIWKVQERPQEDASQSYNMTKWAITLNEEVSEAERPLLPPTDSRLRPDQRALENGLFDLGSKTKQVLEEGQRTRRREMEEAGKKWEPLWFDKVIDEATGRMDYRYKGTFFEQRQKGDWSMCPKIFECAESPEL